MMRRSLPKRRWIVVAAILTMAAGVTHANAGACPGTLHTAFLSAASAREMGTTGPLRVFVGGGCTAASVGGGILCQTFDYGFSIGLRAVWSNATQRTMNPGDGCSFMCPGGDCFVRGADGLPVELLSFGVR